MLYLSQRHKIAGIYEPPPQMVKVIWEWAREQYCAKVLSTAKIAAAVMNKENETEDAVSSWDIVENGLLQRECLKYTDPQTDSEVIRWKMRKQVYNVFPFNSSLWKYVGKSSSPLDVPVRVWMKFEQGQGFDAFWDKDHASIVLFQNTDLLDADQLRNSLSNLYRSIYHELQHLGQAWQRNAPQATSHQEAGFPSRSIQNKYREIYRTEKGESSFNEPPANTPRDPREPDRILHVLRDEEFYTNLKDEIERLKHRLLQVPKKLRMEIVKSFINPAYISRSQTANKEIARLYDRGYMAHSPLFSTLLAQEPKKYRKAVIELFKEIQDEIEMDYNQPDLSSFPRPPGNTPIFGQTVAMYSQDRSYELWNQDDRPKDKKRDSYVAQTIQEYDDYINALNPQQLLSHKESVENSGYGFEYYITPRWRMWDGENLPEPMRDEKGRTIVPPHPKLFKKP